MISQVVVVLQVPSFWHSIKPLPIISNPVLQETGITCPYVVSLFEKSIVPFAIVVVFPQSTQNDIQEN